VSCTNTGGQAAINADSSQYRGIELFYDWRPLDGLRLSGAYTHIDARYINFSDQFLAGGIPTAFVRDGKARCPMCRPTCMNFKEAYDHEASGWGGWVEGSYYNSYFLNNSNTFGIPSYVIANVNIHKNFEFHNNKWFRFAKFFARDRQYRGQEICGLRQRGGR
jgi:iron complex outermembrane receptor protein